MQCECFMDYEDESGLLNHGYSEMGERAITEIWMLSAQSVFQGWLIQYTSALCKHAIKEVFTMAP